MMRRMVLGLALIAWAPIVQATTTERHTEFGAQPLSAYIAPDTLAQRDSTAAAARADTCGPVWIADALRVQAWVGGQGGATGTDSLAITGETSIDRINWVALTGMAATSAGSNAYAILFSRLIETTTANEAAGVELTTTGTNHGVGRWFRLRIVNNNVFGTFLNLSAAIEVVE